MSKAKAILKDLRNLDLYIASLIRRRDKVEASLLSSQKFSLDKVSGGVKRKQDDIYVELLTAKEEIEQKTAEAIRKQRELQGLIDSLDNTDSQAILSLVYIDKMTRWQVNCSDRTYYRLLRQAKRDLDRSCQ